MELCLASISPRVFSFSTIFFFFLQCSTFLSSLPRVVYAVLITGQAVIKNSPKHVAVTADAIIKPTPIETAKAKIIANLLHLFVLQETGFFKTARISNRKNDWWY